MKAKTTGFYALKGESIREFNSDSKLEILPGGADLGQPLKGIKVLDLTRFIAGSLCCMLLGDLGARVIKIEPPLGDDARYVGANPGEESPLYGALNRNKEGIVLDLTKEKGQEVFFRLVRDADVLVENYRPGITEDLGINYEKVKEVNPSIIYGSITAFGDQGPYRLRPGLDMIFQAMSGIMGISGEPTGRPMRPGFPAVDAAGGIIMSWGITAALYEREKTGKGRKVDFVMLEGGIFIQATVISLYFATGKNPPRMGNASPFGLAQDFQTKEGAYIAISVPSQKFWRKLCTTLGLPHLVNDPRFTTNAKRVENQPELARICQEVFFQKTAPEWLEILQKDGIPCGPVNTYEDVLKDPQVQYNQIVYPLAHPLLGKIKTLRSPIKFDGEPLLGEGKHPPLLGEHTAAILRELGYSPAEIELLEETEVTKPKFSPED